MKHIQQLQSVLLNKNEYPDLVDWTKTKNVWVLSTNILETQEPTKSENGTTNFKMIIRFQFIGEVTQDKNDIFECDVETNFQDEYTEEELKNIIIQDIKEEYLEKLFPDYLISDINILNVIWKYLSNDLRSIIKNVICIRYGNDADKLINDISSFDIKKELEKQNLIVNEWYEKLIDLSNYYKKCIKDIKLLEEDLTDLNKE